MRLSLPTHLSTMRRPALEPKSAATPRATARTPQTPSLSLPRTLASRSTKDQKTKAFLNANYG